MIREGDEISMTCPRCKTDSVGNFCQNCGTPLYQSYQYQQQNNSYATNQQAYYPAQTSVSGMCIAGFVCSLVLLGILGLIFSLVGINDCNNQGLSGQGLGIAGVIISIVKLSLFCLAILI